MALDTSLHSFCTYIWIKNHRLTYWLRPLLIHSQTWTRTLTNCLSAAGRRDSWTDGVSSLSQDSVSDVPEDKAEVLIIQGH